MSLNVKDVAQEVDYSDTNWRSKAFNFKEEGEDVLGYSELVINASGENEEVNFKIQLLDSFEPEIVNNPNGTYRETYLLPPGPETVEIRIPLSEFKDLGINLRKIKRLTIHHGRQVWGRGLNDTNTGQIIVEEIEFVRNHDC